MTVSASTDTVAVVTEGFAVVVYVTTTVLAEESESVTTRVVVLISVVPGMFLVSVWNAVCVCSAVTVSTTVVGFGVGAGVVSSSLPSTLTME